VGVHVPATRGVRCARLGLLQVTALPRLHQGAWPVGGGGRGMEKKSRSVWREVRAVVGVHVPVMRGVRYAGNLLQFMLH
jgi:hypothetical protein